MSKRYFCDYCNKPVIDDTAARKKHLQGTMHKRIKKLHYKQYRDSKMLFEEESSKPECKRFLQSGQCQFGEHCNYTHYSQAQLSEIKRQVDEEKRMKKLPALPPVESWLKERNKDANLIEVPSSQQAIFPESSDLPVSLRPINVYDVVNIELSEWG